MSGIPLAARASYAKPRGQYHHGDLRAALIRAAHDILQEEGLVSLSLRGVARAAGVSQTAPYRHFHDREALLVAVALDGFAALDEEIAKAGRRCADDRVEAVVAMGGAYIRFATGNREIFRLMFGRDIAHRRAFPDLVAAMESLSDRIGEVLARPALGIGLWAAMHGLACLLVEEATDLGAPDPSILPGRAEIILRSLLSHLAEA